MNPTAVHVAQVSQPASLPPAQGGSAASLLFPALSSALSDSRFCILQFALCIHETRIVPRFFSLYRQIQSFLLAPGLSRNSILVLPWLLAFGHVVISLAVALVPRLRDRFSLRKYLV